MPRSSFLVVRLAVALLASGMLAGCYPVLTDGRYACDTGRCPAGWSCWSDGYCYVASEADGGASDAPPSDVPSDVPSDAPGSPDGGGGCGCTAPLTCVADSYCAPPCPGGTCPGDGICSAGICLRPCEGATCPGTSVCALGDWSGSAAGTAACVAAESVFPATHGASCGTCLAPDTCVSGRCMRTCASDGLDCGGGEVCRRAPPPAADAMVCVTQMCDPTPCPRGTLCTEQPVGPRTCLPVGWPAL